MHVNGLNIIEKYDGAVNYLYPLLINMSHKHRVLRDTFIAAMLDQYRLFYEAAKSGHKSKLYVADAGLAYLKEILRLMVKPARKLVSRRQYEVASVHLSETGRLVGAWLHRLQKR